MPATYTADQARAEYPANIKRAAVLEIGAKCGLSSWSVRCLIEGPEAPLKARHFAGQRRGYFRLEEVIEQLFTN